MPVTKIKSLWESGSLVFKRMFAATESSVILGEDTKGLDFKVFGTTTGKYMQYDNSADKLIIVGTSDLGTTAEADNYTVGGTAGVSWTSGAAPTSMQIIKGIVTYVN